MQHIFPTIILAVFLSIYKGSADWCYPNQFSCNAQCLTPDKWDQENVACGGQAQSPININTKKTVKNNCLQPFHFQNYQRCFASQITNYGYTASIGLPQMATISGGDLMTSYKVVKLHMHWGSNAGPGSEHTIDGEQYPMELHIVHMKQQYNNITNALRDPNGIAVLGFFFEESSTPNKNYDKIINALKEIKVADASAPLTSISLAELIPPQQYLTKYYRYQGSLTIPACAQAVVWTVFEQTIPLSKEQLQAFYELQASDGSPLLNTFRPVQPLNGRPVYRSGGAVVVVSAALLAASMVVAMGVSLGH